MSLAAAVLILMTAVIGYYLYSFHQRMKFFQRLGIPNPETRYFYGNAHKLKFGTMQPYHTLQQWRNKYGKVFGFYMGTSPQLVVCDADIVKQILVTDFWHFSDRQDHAALGSGLDNNLLDLKGQHWQKVRRILTPAFSSSKLRLLHQIITRHVRHLLDNLDENVTEDCDTDMYDCFKKLIIDISGETLLATNINSQQKKHSPLLEAIVRMFNSYIPPQLLALLYSSNAVKTLLKYASSFHPPAKHMMNIRKDLLRVLENRKSHSQTRTVDMLQLMLDASNETPIDVQKKMSNVKLLSNHEIVSNSIVLLLASFDTTVATLTNIIYRLVHNPHVQDKLHEEILSKIKDPSNVSFDDTKEVPYMDQVINETLRLHTPIWTTERRANVDYKLDKMEIPKGTDVIVAINIIHRDPELWPEPEKFSPENKSKIHSGAHIPFGIGPRMCIGQTFAMAEMKTILISLLSKYRFCQPTCHRFEPETFISVVGMSIKDNLFVKIVERAP